MMGGPAQPGCVCVCARRQGQGRGQGAPPRDEGWSEDPTPPVMHPFTAALGLTVPVPTTPLGFVQLFLTREVLEYLVAEASDYTRYCCVELKKAIYRILHITWGSRYFLACAMSPTSGGIGNLIFLCPRPTLPP